MYGFFPSIQRYYIQCLLYIIYYIILCCIVIYGNNIFIFVFASGMLTYAYVCWRMLTYADGWWIPGRPTPRRVFHRSFYSWRWIWFIDGLTHTFSTLGRGATEVGVQHLNSFSPFFSGNTFASRFKSPQPLVLCLSLHRHPLSSSPLSPRVPPHPSCHPL